MTTAWTPDELARIAAADELEIAARRRDGTLRKGVTIWVVRHDDSLYDRHAQRYTPHANHAPRDFTRLGVQIVEGDLAFDARRSRLRWPLGTSLRSLFTSCGYRPH